MAGSVSKTFGSILTVLGALAFVLGLVLVAWGLTAVEAESEKAIPNESRMEGGLAVTTAGLAGAALGFLLLLVGLPLLIYGLNRVRDPKDGRVVTRPGGGLKAWGITFLVLGGGVLLVGLVAAAFGAGVLDEETQRLFPNDDRAEAAGALAIGSLAVAALGLLLLLVGLPLAIAGASRARAAQVVTPTAGGGGVVTRTRGGGSSTGLAVGLAAGAALLALLLLLAFGSVGPGGLGEAADDEARATTRSFTGSLRGGALPQVGGVGENATHVVTPQTSRGVVEAHLEWDASTSRGPMLLVVEAMGADGAWREIARGQGGTPLVVAGGAEPLPGDVRVRVSFGEGGGGAVNYRLTVNVSPS